MGNGDVMNNLSISKNYFNRLLYQEIWTLDSVKTKNGKILNYLNYYNKRKGKKKLYDFIHKIYFIDVINNFKNNFVLKNK
tara:strand:- start:3513 stop:3752 length:240 start_codon:yes stop_codon:yes gene_type:complete